MRIRNRLLPAAFALLAMTLSLAETVWASSCPPGMDASMMAMDSNAADAHADVDGTPCTAHGHDDRPHEDAERCPFGVPGPVPSCAAVASLPGHAAQAPAPPTASAAAVFAHATRPNLLSSTALFHPPRA